LKPSRVDGIEQEIDEIDEVGEKKEGKEKQK
jgi:hypothetical protein